MTNPPFLKLTNTMERFFFTFGATGLLLLIMWPLAKIVKFVVTVWTLFLVWLTSGELLFALPNWVSSETNFLISTALIQLISVYYTVSIPLYVIVYIYFKKSEAINWKVIFFLPYLCVAMLILIFMESNNFERIWSATCLILSASLAYYRFKTHWLNQLMAKV